MMDSILSSLHQRFSVCSDPAVASFLERRVAEAERSLAERIRKEFPFVEQIQDYQYYKAIDSDSVTGQVLCDAINKYLLLAQKWKQPSGEIQYWEDILNQSKRAGNKRKRSIVPTYQLLLEKWGKLCAIIQAEWEKVLRESFRQQLFDELQELLSKLQQLWPILLAMKDDSEGLWDRHKEHLACFNAGQLQKWTDYLRNDTTIQGLVNDDRDSMPEESNSAENEVRDRMKELLAGLSGRFRSCSDEAVYSELLRRMAEGEQSLKSELADDDFRAKEWQILEYEKLLMDGGDISSGRMKSMVSKYEAFVRLSKKKIDDKKFWEDGLTEFSKGKDNSVDSLHFAMDVLLVKWATLIQEASKERRLSIQNSFLEQKQKEWEEWLSLLDAIQEVFASLDSSFQFGWDLSKGTLKQSDVSKLREWVEYLKNNQEIKDLCDLLGKIHSAEKILEKESVEILVNLPNALPDINSREELSGVCFGNSLGSVVPQEFALLRNPSTEMLFYKKFAEAQLLSFDMMGYADDTKEKVEEVEKEGEEEKGPMILCVDTSGSMTGMPESIAKAIVFTMAARARSQHRACKLVSFSTDIFTMDLDEKMGVGDLIRFLEFSFSGGTDATPALRHALAEMKKKQFKKADVLMISDFLMSTLPKNDEEGVLNQKKRGNAFYSLCIGNYIVPQQSAIWNRCWVFEPNSMSILELTRMLGQAFPS